MLDISVLIENFIIDYAYLGSFLLVLLEYANVPLPSEIVLPMIGVITGKFEFNLFFIIILTSIGGLIGSLINYYLGYRYGINLVKKLEEKHPSIKKPIRSAQACLNKYNKRALLLSRVVPLARTTISIVAGVSKADLKTFIIYSVTGITIWNSILIYLGVFFSDNMHIIGSILSKYSMICIIVFILGAAYILFSKKIKKR